MGVLGNTYIGGNLNVTNSATIQSNVYINSSQAATSTGTGALTVQGGVGVIGNTYIGGNLVLTNSATIQSNVYINSSQAATSTGTGALIVQGGVGIQGNVYMGGNGYVLGNLYVTGGIYMIGNLVGTGSGGGSVSNYGDVSFNNGNIYINNTTASSGIGSGGALIVKGGANIAGNLYVGGKTNLFDWRDFLLNPATNNIDFTNFGATWKQNTLSTNVVAISNAISWSGKYQTLLGGSSLNNINTIYTSADYGITWIPVITFPQNGNTVAMSASGEYQTAGGVASIYISNNFGNTWTTVAGTNIPGGWNSISISASGLYQTALPVTKGNINLSTDYGNTWVPVTSIVNRPWTSISISASGQYQTAVTNVDPVSAYIYISKNYGSTWNINNSISDTNFWTSVSVSATGQYQTATTNNDRIYVSNNYGTTWSPTTFNGAWQRVVVSSSGQFQAVANYNGYIVISNNYGVTWNQNLSSIKTWSSIAMSSSGQYMTATTSNGIQGTWTSSVNDISYNGNLFVTGGAIFVSGTMYSSSILPPIITTYFSDTTMQGNVTMGGNLFVNNSSIFVGGTLISNGTIPIITKYVTDVSYSGNVNIMSTNVSNSTNTGALVVNGGVGVQGNIFLGGNINVSGNSIMQGNIVCNRGIITPYLYAGFLSKGSGTFDISHPIVPNKRLIHSFTESPRCDNIYRGKARLMNGYVNINIDKDCVNSPECAMTEGTFVALCTNPTYYVQNIDSFDRVIGDICGNNLHIRCENPSSNDHVHWFVIAERQDDFIKKWDKTNPQGYLITEYSQ